MEFLLGLGEPHAQLIGLLRKKVVPQSDAAVNFKMPVFISLDEFPEDWLHDRRIRMLKYNFNDVAAARNLDRQSSPNNPGRPRNFRSAAQTGENPFRPDRFGNLNRN